MYTLRAPLVLGKDLVLVSIIRPDLHDGGHVAAAVAVIGGRPHRCQVLCLEPLLVALLD
jgi:hypothetical protein